jgi:hypothetical protein
MIPGLGFCPGFIGGSIEAVPKLQFLEQLLTPEKIA